MLSSLLMLFLAVAFGRPADPPDGPPVDRERVHRLLRRLGSGSLEARDAAERDLLRMGTTILPLVVAAGPARGTAFRDRPGVVDGEREFRRRDIQHQLERMATAQAIEPAVVTLSIRDATAAEAVSRVCEASGNRMAVDAAVDGPAQEPPAKPISIDCDRFTFWEALADVLDQAGLDLDFPPESGPRIVRPPAGRPDDGTGRPGRPVAAGPLRVEVARVEPTGGNTGGVRMVLRIAWEPRLEPLLVRLPMASVVAEGPAGEAMPPGQRAAVVEATAVGRRGWLDLPLVLPQPDPPLESLGMLRGTLELWLAGREQAFEFDLEPLDPKLAGEDRVAGERPPSLRMARAEVSLRQVALQADRLLVTASVVYDEPSEALASHRTWLAARPLEVIDAEGRPVEKVGQSVEERSDRGLTTTGVFRFSGGGPFPLRGMRVRWTLPMAIHEVPVDFAIRRVALPAPRRPSPLP